MTYNEANARDMFLMDFAEYPEDIFDFDCYSPLRSRQAEILDLYVVDPSDNPKTLRNALGTLKSDIPVVSTAFITTFFICIAPFLVGLLA